MRITIAMAVLTSAVVLAACGGWAHAGMMDGFEAYTPGSYPGAHWTNRFSGVSQYVSDAVAYEGDQSFRLEGGPSSAAESYRIVEKPQTPIWSVQAAMRCDAWPGGSMGGGAWSYTPNGEHQYGILYTGIAGTLYPQIAHGGPIDYAHPIALETWYLFDADVDEATETVDWYITLPGDLRELMFDDLPLPAGDPAWNNRFQVHGGQSSVDYFDAITVVPEPTTAAIIVLGGGLLLKRRR